MAGLAQGCSVIVLFVLAISFAQTGTDAAPAAASEHGRALPLNHFHYVDDEISSGEPSASWHRMAVAIADDYFDGTSDPSRVRRHLQVAKQLGVRYLRCAFSWNGIEKTPGKYEWAFWDNLVAEADRAGIELIPYVAYTPEWASKKHEMFWAEPPRDVTLYAAFMSKIVSRYRGKICAWEIWNEPDNAEYWKGSVEEYADLVRRTAVAMRRADPATVLVLGGMSRGPGEFFRELISKHGIGEYVDVIAMHAYPETWDEERLETIYKDWIDQMSQLISRDAPGADFWINEMGYADYRYLPNQATKWGIHAYYNYEHTSAYQANVLFKAEVMSLASPRVSLTAWYRIDDFSPSRTHFSPDEANYHLGLVDAEGKPKPAFRALEFFRKILGQPVQRLNWQGKGGSSAEVALFRRADNRIVFAAWLRSSRAAEVDEGNGMERDHRKERVSIEVPCNKGSELQMFDAEGRRVRSSVKLRNRELRSVVLNGQDVVVGVMGCEK
jgi:GH35 family endo-1,4-beta-xylanase